jgi:hypothetical protein
MTPQSTLEEFGERPFSFYPPLLGVEHNEWTYRKSTWSEILVQNTQNDLGIWIPRVFLGEVSQVDKPVMIVGLRRELEYRGGAVWLHERRIVEMPKAVNEPPPPSAEKVSSPQPPASMNVRMGGAESKVGRLILIAIGVGILSCVTVVLLLREGGPAHRIVYNAVLQSDLGFSGNDDYYSVVNRFGPPAEDRWRSDQGELQYRLLWYPKPGLYLVLMGPDRKDVHYIGAFDKNWRVVHSVDNNKEAMLRRLKRF